MWIFLPYNQPRQNSKIVTVEANEFLSKWYNKSMPTNEMNDLVFTFFMKLDIIH